MPALSSRFAVSRSPRGADSLAHFLAVSASTLLAACGAGTAAAVSSGGSSSGGSNAPPSISGFTVLDPKEPREARVRFVLADPEADPAEVQVFYQAPGESAEPVTQAGANPMMLATSSQGVEHTIPWNFAAEPELPDDASFLDGVQVFARVEGGIQELVLGANAASIGLGNDAPEIRDVIVPAQEENGIVGIEYTALDSSSDVISVRIEYDVQGDDPDLGWQLARPALSPATPLLAVQNVVAAADPGTTLSFFWDTGVDLAKLEFDVKLRFTALDPVVEGAPVESAAFRVDNNEEPIVTLGEGLLLLNPDQRNGIPIPYTLHDAEADEVELVFQWKYPEQSFPALPATKEAIRALLADPAERKLHQVCAAYPTWFEGRAGAVTATTVRVRELASGSARFAQDLAGRELEVLRRHALAEPIASTWTSNPLDHPVAVLALGDGLDALVLDRAGAETWRLREIELATGAVKRTLVAGAPGEPDAMAFERDKSAVIVASHVDDAWSVDRVELESGALAHLTGFDGTTDAGRARAIVSVGRNAALITVGSSLVRLEYFAGEPPRAVTLFDDLATPWGIALDPHRSDRVYVAEHDAATGASEPGRIVLCDLSTRERRAVPIGAADPTLPRVAHPRALAFDHLNSGLYVVEDEGGAEPAAVEHIALGLADGGMVTRASSVLASGVGGIASGREGLLLAALASGDLAVGGGVEQRRTIVELGADRETVRVARAFEPELAPIQRLRIAQPGSVIRPSASGSQGTFVWDSSDVTAPAEVHLRAVPLDSEAGVDGITKGAKAVRSAAGSAAFTIPSQVHQGFVPVDLDADGDLDLVGPTYSGIRVSYRTRRGRYAGYEYPVLLEDSTERSHFTLCTGDLDGDGDMDLALTNPNYNSLSVVFQSSPGVFDGPALELGDSGLTDVPLAVIAADLDGDGDLDLASSNSGSIEGAAPIAVFFQDAPGEFGERALSLGSGAGQGLAAADIDGDGDVDLITATSTALSGGSLLVFLQTAPGAFGAPIVLGDASVGASGVAVADLDADGDLDLACQEYFAEGGSAPISYLQTRAGSFARVPLAITGSIGSMSIQSLGAADFDADGDVDLGGASTGGPVMLEQCGPGAFRFVRLPDPGATVGSSTSAHFADLDRDGASDVVSGGYIQGLERKALRSTNLPGWSADIESPIRVLDVDGDGNLDVVMLTNLRRLAIRRQTSRGIFDASPILLGTELNNEGTTSIAGGDLDGDGDVDLATANSNTNTLSVYFQESPGLFAPVPLTLGNANSTSNPRSVVAADIDGDSRIDLACANKESDSIAVFFQDEHGVLGVPPVSIGGPSVMRGPEELTAADLDGDGDLDLVTANPASDRLTIFFQEGPGSFGPTPLRLGNGLVTRRPRSVAVADLDADGDMDLATWNEGGGTIAVFWQEDRGAFSPVPTWLGPPVTEYGPVYGQGSVGAADYDGDGKLDILAYVGGSLNVFHQIGVGAFAQTAVTFGSGNIPPYFSIAPRIAVPADLDGDGDPDFVLASGSSVTAFWNNH